MDFSFSEDQQTIKDVADKIFSDLCDDETIRECFKEEKPLHKALWQTLGENGLLAAPLPAAYGGSELGLTEICLIIEGQGTAVAPIPLIETVIECAMPIAEFAEDALKQRILPGVASGETMLSAVRPYQGLRDKTPLAATNEADTWVLNGESSLVSYAPVANGFLVVTDALVAYVDADVSGLTITEQTSMSGETCGHLKFENVQVAAENVVATGEAVAQLVEWQQQRTYIAMAAQQVAILKEGLQRAADYTVERKQFGKPLASFQAVAHQAADAYMVIEALRGVYWRALDDIEAGRDARLSARVAKFWVAEAGHIASHILLHIHGGIGQDLDYPAHRFFIWAKQNENYLGAANQLSSQLGELIKQDTAAVAI